MAEMCGTCITVKEGGEEITRLELNVSATENC